MATAALTRPKTLADSFVPAANVLQQALLIVAGSLLVALTAKITIYLPFTPVPITGQTYGVLLVAAALGSWRGGLSLALYLVEGWAGLPFFATGASAASTGYLFGFVLAAIVVGWLSEHGWDRGFAKAAVAMIIGEVAIYLVGLPWLATFVGAAKAVPLGLLPFIPGDVVKLILAAATLPLAWKLVNRRSA